jgi:hypothetical protein
MNDTDVINEVRERFGEIHMTTSLDAVVARGRTLRRRKRNRHRLAVAVAAAGVALAAVKIWPDSSPGASLAAWTVSKEPAGIVAVKIRELNDPAGLQRTLRQDGVPAIVRFNGQNPPDCLIDPVGSPADYGRIFPHINHAQSAVAFDINPSAIPRGVGLWIEVSPETRTTSGTVESYSFSMRAVQVYASGRCPVPGNR